MTGTVLLAMDFQHGIADRFAETGVLERVRAAVDAARAADVPVVWVRVAFRPGYPEAASSPVFSGAQQRYGSAMISDDPGTQIHQSVGFAADDLVVVKRRVSAFTGSDLAVVLRALGAQQLVLAGISTSGVVLSTVRQAADLDFRLVVLADACADADPEVHGVLTEKVFVRQAEVVDVADWASSLAVT